MPATRRCKFVTFAHGVDSCAARLCRACSSNLLTPSKVILLPALVTVTVSATAPGWSVVPTRPGWSVYKLSSCCVGLKPGATTVTRVGPGDAFAITHRPSESALVRSEEHTSELQSQSNLVCR